MCQGLPSRRHFEKREDPGDEVVPHINDIVRWRVTEVTTLARENFYRLNNKLADKKRLRMLEVSISKLWRTFPVNIQTI